MLKSKASTGWLDKFLNRHGLSNRKPTTVCQKPPSDYAQKLVDFVMYVSNLRDNQKFSHIYAADETSVWLDASSNRCVDEKGTKEVNTLIKIHSIQILMILIYRFLF